MEITIKRVQAPASYFVSAVNQLDDFGKLPSAAGVGFPSAQWRSEPYLLDSFIMRMLQFNDIKYLHSALCVQCGFPGKESAC